ncbi:hypothetical protein [Xanthovirga aplysinae]|uniref:hypothetical protein n=1 Tax=Xanthovirga aplysinae TaxID=2529853 RepID=UPI0012BC0687|nr:hypothetical protein [Xanthovirga aplysinae]MTI32496.1 hypothetical protein [Xanthovirga aplysinae]
MKTEILEKRPTQSNFSNSYDDLVNRLKKLERTEIQGIENMEDPEAKNKKVKEIETKYKTLRITTKYAHLITMTGMYEGFYKAFTSSSKSRIRFLKDDHLKIGVNKENLGEIKDKEEKGFEQLDPSAWVEWKGCEMYIPEKTHIVLNPNLTWPTLYMRSEDGEITIDERAWGAEVYSYPEELINDNSNNKKSSLGKNSEFNQLTVEVKEKLEEFHIVIELPFASPRADVLTKVNFCDKKEAIILTTIC